MSIFRNIAVTAVALISATNIFGSLYLNKNQSEEKNANVSNESVEESNDQVATTLSTESTTEIATTQTSTTITTTAAITEATGTTVSTVQTTTSKPSPVEKYEISSIAKLNNEDINSFQSYAVDPNNNTIYYIDRNLDSYYADVTYYIYKYDISNKSIELVKELPYDSHLYPICLTYNQFDNKVYCFAGGGSSQNNLSYFQIESNEFHVLNTKGNTIFLSDYNHFENTNYKSFYYISATEFVIRSIHTGRVYLYNTLDESSNIGAIGVLSAELKGESDTPFMYNDNYYWLCSRSSGFSIVKSQKLFYPLNSGDDTYYGDNLNKFSTDDGWIAANVYNDTVYLMKDDFSIYKIDLDILEKLYVEQSQEDENNNLIITPENDDNSEKALSLVIDGKEIKQTGINNLTSIKFFSVVSEDSILVYDDFDKNYKLISAIK